MTNQYLTIFIKLQPLQTFNLTNHYKSSSSLTILLAINDEKTHHLKGNHHQPAMTNDLGRGPAISHPPRIRPDGTMRPPAWERAWAWVSGLGGWWVLANCWLGELVNTHDGS